MGNRILVLGYFGYVSNKLDGQTVKTREIYDMIKRRSCRDVAFFDSEELQAGAWRLVKLLWLVLCSHTIVYLPGQNNLKRFFSPLYCVAKFCRKEIIYVVVGGWLADFLADNPSTTKRLKRVKSLLVETSSLQANLVTHYGFDNVSLIANFRSQDFVPTIKWNKGFRIVYMGRIIPEKGCDIILDFAKYYSSLADCEAGLRIDFYGQIDVRYQERFLGRVAQYDFVSYKGVVGYHTASEVMSNYDVCVLPTFYSGEGCPGVVIDAYRAGIPVVVSRWKDIPEFVDDGKTGLIFDLERVDDFFHHLLWLRRNPDKLLQMKIYAYHKSRDHSESKAWRVMSPLLA